MFKKNELRIKLRELYGNQWAFFKFEAEENYW